MVYEVDRCYRELYLDFNAEKVWVVDASGSSIESREAALQALWEVGSIKWGQGQVLQHYTPLKKSPFQIAVKISMWPGRFFHSSITGCPR